MIERVRSGRGDDHSTLIYVGRRRQARRWLFVFGNHVTRRYGHFFELTVYTPWSRRSHRALLGPLLVDVWW